jgi:S1-C subfamily serine protease
VEAVKWYRKAAEQDDANAQLNLGCCYADGRGISKDKVEAYKWFSLSVVLGNEKALDACGAIANIMTPDQIAKAQQLSREWKLRGTKQDAFPTTQEAADKPKVTGTGFLITQNGYLVTNHHVVKDSDKVRVQASTGLLDAVVVRTDAASDLALLKVSGTFDALPVVSSRNSRLGSTVATVGFPNVGLQGFEPKLSKGDISSLAGIQDDVKQFQISVPVQPGNSGGALVDERGNVVGVVSAQLSQKAALESTGALAQSVNYAIKSSYLLSFLEAVPEVGGGLIDAKTNDQKFEAVVDDVKKATVLIIGY